MMSRLKLPAIFLLYLLALCIPLKNSLAMAQESGQQPETQGQTKQSSPTPAPGAKTSSANHLYSGRNCLACLSDHGAVAA